MSEGEFVSYWSANYPEGFPISSDLKWDYPDRWFRIHSLPGSKRYAETAAEYQLILDRQNNVFNDLVGEESAIFIAIGWQREEEDEDEGGEELDRFGAFRKVQTIKLHQERPEVYEEAMYFDVYVSEAKWERGAYNVLLKAIANDEIRALFVCPAQKCLLAPYDGGMDIIVETTQKRDALKANYQDWLSKRPDGM